MPIIKRWYPANQSLNRDPQFRQLRQAYGDWMGFVWHEMLSIGDQNQGVIAGTTARIAESLAHISMWQRTGMAAKRIESAFEYMTDCGWIAVRKAGEWQHSEGLIRLHRLLSDRRVTRECASGDHRVIIDCQSGEIPLSFILVVKYARYHKSWEIENLLLSSLPSDPNLPNHLKSTYTDYTTISDTKSASNNGAKPVDQNSVDLNSLSDDWERKNQERLDAILK